MLNTTQVTIVGNIGADPEMRYTPTGNAVTSFSVAVAARKYNKVTNSWDDAGTTWYRINAWRNLAENVAASLQRGQRVIVIGALASREWDKPDGTKGIAWEVTAEAIGPDLSYATATVQRVTRDSAPVPDDPWADQPADTGSATQADTESAVLAGNGKTSKPAKK